MAPVFHIQVVDLPFPFTDYIEANVPIFAPPSEYPASLQSIPKSIYDQLREQQWTDMDCYEYFTCLEKFMEFESTWLRHNGWKEQKIQEWNEACWRFYFVPGIKEKDPKDHHFQMALAAQRSTVPRVLLCEEMDARAE
ncbi:uncharacterized protein N7483_002889 [Penicillium malachiteum]|uniref:uncharacterized protein n=1 Tax=Penicillium malachiteum TaxID=1324776 RepID=UPI0025481764|nr:uncharacterized protein N7483_002889 [Penicillium malachiteum]KAJ5737764.1 hypothetical protein N7483_002889 [Penicillium malachiteum]